MYDTSLEMKTSPADIEPSLGEDDSVTTLSPSMSSTSLVSNPNLTARMAEEKQPEHLQEDVSYHPRFYIRGSMIDIRVEDTMFRIPQFFLTRHSEYFREILKDRDTQKESQPLRLDDRGDVKADAFANLLDVLDPPNLHAISISTVDEWSSVLHLASKWNFGAVRALAVRHLADLASPIHKIALARTYHLEHWLVDAYVAVCERPEALTLTEARQLPLDDVVKIGQTRQLLRGHLRPSAKPRRAVTRVLGLGLEDAAREPDSLPSAVSDSHSHTDILRVTLSEGAASGSTTADPADDERETLPAVAVVELVTEGLSLLVDRSPESHQRGQDEILTAVRRSGKHSRTLRSVLTLIIDKGIETWSEESAGAAGSRCAAVCGIISDMIGPDVKDSTLVDFSGHPLEGSDAICHYITAVCQERVVWASIDEAAKSDRAMRQAGFFAELYARQLLSVDLMKGWWIHLLDIYDQSLSIDISRMRHIHAFLSAVGSLIDVSAVQSLVDSVFRQLSNKHRYDDWDTVQPEVRGLIALRERKWADL